MLITIYRSDVMVVIKSYSGIFLKNFFRAKKKLRIYTIGGIV